MGDLYDVLVVALGAGGIASTLARSLTSWFTVRGSDIASTLRFRLSALGCAGRIR
ncbi:hypothetical protein [Nocardia sp. NPDC057030]|uniref:effector-associated constant component EACC1 n=1 Tax=unclassified Nocardia TaxID=2637762 RepID=UPI00364108E9